MKRELGIADCGLACCLCSENDICRGCHSEQCPDQADCIHKKCIREKGVTACWNCKIDCRKGVLQKLRPYVFVQFIKRYGTERLLACLAHNEAHGICYHRKGLEGDYDRFTDEESLVAFILKGK